MPSFPHITVDPYLLCLPSPCHSARQLDDFVSNLLAWAEANRREDIRILVSDGCKAALIEDGLYPFPQLARLLRAQGVDYVDHKTICRVAQALLDASPTLEDVCEISDILHDETKASVVPELFVTRLGGKTGGALTDSLVVLACWQRVCRPEAPSCVIASAWDMELDGDNTEVLLVAEVLEAQGRGIKREAGAPFPMACSNVFVAYDSFSAVLKHLGSLRLWGDGESEQNARDAIDVRVGELLEAGAATRGDVLAYRLGPSFLESVRRWGFALRRDLASNLIDSCARVIIGQPKHSMKPFRTTDAPTAPQRVRADGALAFRIPLTKHGAGFRLMLWKHLDGIVEFANVGDKDELEIA